MFFSIGVEWSLCKNEKAFIRSRDDSFTNVCYFLVIEDAEKKQLDEASQLSLPENNEDSTESSEKNETENISNLQFTQLEHNFGPRNPRHDPYRREHQPHSRDFFHGELTRNREQHHPLNPQSSHVGQQLDHHLQYSCVSDGNQYSPSRKELHQDFHDAATFPMLPNWNLPPVEGTSKGWYPPDYDGRLRNPEPDKHFKKVESDANNKTNNTQGNIVIKELDSLKPVAKLIPRQVRKRKVLPEGLLGQVTKTTRDSVNEELRRTAFILGKDILKCCVLFRSICYLDVLQNLAV